MGSAGVQAIGDLFAIISRHPAEILELSVRPSCLSSTLESPLFDKQSRPAAEELASSNVWPLLDLAAADREAHTQGNQDHFRCPQQQSLFQSAEQHLLKPSPPWR